MLYVSGSGPGAGPDGEPVRGKLGGKLHHIKKFLDPRAHFRPVALDAEFTDHPPDLGADGERRVQGVVRVLEDHLQRAKLLGRAVARHDVADFGILEAHRAAG